MNGFFETVIRSVEYEIPRLVVAGEFGGESAAKTSSVNDDMTFTKLNSEGIVHELHIAQHFFFRPFAGAFTEPPVIYQYHIIIIAEKIPCIPGPAFDATGIAMKIKDQPQRLIHFKMQPIDANARFYIKKQFFKGSVVFVNKVLVEFFGLKDEPFLYQVNDNDKQQVSCNDV